MRNNRTWPIEYWVATFDTQEHAKAVLDDPTQYVDPVWYHPGRRVWCTIIPQAWHASVAIAQGFLGWLEDTSG